MIENMPVGYYRSHMKSGACEAIDPPPIESGIALAVYSDEVKCVHASALNPDDAERLLEIRIFNDNSEYHAVRSALGAMFAWRFIQDEAGARDFGESVLDDVHFLDIDVRKSNPEAGEYKSIGGGSYTLPIANAERMLIRNYLEYDADGLAHIVDFRLVKIMKRGDGNG